MVNSSEQERSLFLCVTPLQARICLKIIELEKVKNFDIIYYATQISETAEAYYRKLKEIAVNAIIIEIKNAKDLLKSNFFLPHPFLNKNNYNRIYLASIDNILFKNIIKKNKKSKIYTFDDGTANIFKESNYFNSEYIGKSKKQIIFLKIFNLPTKSEIFEKSLQHYTIFNNFENKAIKQKTKTISIFDKEKNEESTKNISFFIGQPFYEYLSEAQILKLKNYLNNKKIDYYVMHPREIEPILKNIKILDKESEMAEVAIIKKTGKNRPLIISGFSTVLFNIDSEIADKIYLSLDNDHNEKRRIELIKKTGSKIIQILSP